MHAIRQSACSARSFGPSVQLVSTARQTSRRQIATSCVVSYPRQVVRRSTPANEIPSTSSAPIESSQKTTTAPPKNATVQHDLPWYLRAQAETPQVKELEASRRTRARDVNQLGEADAALPPALKGLHDLLKTGSVSPLIARPDDGEVESETGRTPVSYIHARQHDEQSWCDWLVVVQVRTNSGSAVSRVARQVGGYLETAKPPLDHITQQESGSPDVDAKRHWRPYKILSREAQDGLRLLHAEDPERWSRKALAEAFKMSVESVRRILKSKWQPSSDVVARQNRRIRERREERQTAYASKSEQHITREHEEVQRIRAMIAQSNENAGRPHHSHDSIDADEYRVVNEDGSLYEQETRRQKVRYEGLVGTSYDGQQHKAATSRVRSGVTRGDGEWCLVDAGWCVVHVMTARARTTYDVERQYLASHDDRFQLDN